MLGIPFFAHGDDMQFCIYEDSAFSSFLPLVYLRPVFDLRCGIFTLSERIDRLLPSPDRFYAPRTSLLPLVRQTRPVDPAEKAGDPLVLVNGRALGDEDLRKLLRSHLTPGTVYRNDSDVVVACITVGAYANLRRSPDGTIAADAFDRMVEKKISTRTLQYPWDLITHAGEEIVAGAAMFRRSLSHARGVRKYPGVHLVKPGSIFLGKGVVLKPGAVLDATDGPIVLGNNVQVLPNAVIEGPAAIGEGSIIKIGAKIYAGTAAGEFCKLGGEIEASVIQSYANKQHDGFLGHSYIGSWVNLGADTNTSDLKNTYGSVSVEVEGKQIDTGLQFLGLIAADHSKSGINMMFTTGTIVGISCNLYGAELPPKAVPSFSWGMGSALEVYELEKSVDVARKVMARRNVTMSAEYEALFRSVFHATAAGRKERGVV